MLTSQSQPKLVIGIACALTIMLGFGRSAYNLTRPWPVHQWESGMVAEAQRVAVGLPVFEPAETGHATHMYGPMTNWIVGGVFKLFGPSLYPGRLLSLFSIVAAVALLIRLTRPEDSWLGPSMVVAMLTGFGQAANSYVEIRPDATSCLAAIIAVWLMFEAVRRDKIWWLVAAAVMSVVAMLFKQPAAMVTGVPLLGMLIARERLTMRRLVFALVPFASCIAVLVAIRIAFPQAFHYMVTVPSQYKISYADCAGWLGWFCMITTGFWIGLIWSARLNDSDSVSRRRCSTRTAWIIAAAVISVPCCVVTAGKEGGTSNSLLLSLLAVSGLFLHFSDPLERHLRAEPKEGSNFTMAAVLAACMLLPMWVTSIHSPNSTFGDAGFLAIQDFARQQTSKQFVSPYDPALSVMSGAEPGRCMMLEFDAAGWPQMVPGWFLSEVANADYVATVTGWRAWPLSTEQVESMMLNNGFDRVVLPALANSTYQLWVRSQ